MSNAGVMGVSVLPPMANAPAVEPSVMLPKLRGRAPRGGRDVTGTDGGYCTLEAIGIGDAGGIGGLGGFGPGEGAAEVADAGLSEESEGSGDKAAVL